MDTADRDPVAFVNKIVDGLFAAIRAYFEILWLTLGSRKPFPHNSDRQPILMSPYTFFVVNSLLLHFIIANIDNVSITPKLQAHNILDQLANMPERFYMALVLFEILGVICLAFVISKLWGLFLTPAQTKQLFDSILYLVGVVLFLAAALTLIGLLFPSQLEAALKAIAMYLPYDLPSIDDPLFAALLIVVSLACHPLVRGIRADNTASYLAIFAMASIVVLPGDCAWAWIHNHSYHGSLQITPHWPKTSRGNTNMVEELPLGLHEASTPANNDLSLSITIINPTDSRVFISTNPWSLHIQATSYSGYSFVLSPQPNASTWNDCDESYSLKDLPVKRWCIQPTQSYCKSQGAFYPLDPGESCVFVFDHIVASDEHTHTFPIVKKASQVPYLHVDMMVHGLDVGIFGKLNDTVFRASTTNVERNSIISYLYSLIDREQFEPYRNEPRNRKNVLPIAMDGHHPTLTPSPSP